MKRFVAMLLALIVLTQMTPIMQQRAYAEVDVAPERASDESLRAELEEYGSIDAAMDAYAKTVYEKVLKMEESKLLSTELNEFRIVVDHVCGTKDDPNVIMNALLELGYAKSERDDDWAITENNIALYIQYILILAEMDELGFEHVKDTVDGYMPEFDLSKDALQFIVNLTTEWTSRSLKREITATKDVITRYTKYLDDPRYRPLYEATTNQAKIDLPDLEATKFIVDHLGKGIGLNQATIDVMQDSNVPQITNASEQITSGLALLEYLEGSQYANSYFAEAYTLLQNVYYDYQQALQALPQQENSWELLTDSAYLDNLFFEILNERMPDDTLATVTKIGTGLVNLVSSNAGLFSLIVDGALLSADLLINVESFYTHFHGLAVIDTIYEAILSKMEKNDLATWSDYYEYAEGLNYLCNLSLLGDRHLYEMNAADATVFQKLSSKIDELCGWESYIERTERWYSIRLNSLNELYLKIDDYMTGIMSHYAALCAVEPDITPLLGHENESTAVLYGTITEGEWYAKIDGSEEPDLNKPNPNKGTVVHDLSVCLLADETIIAETVSMQGSYYLIYNRADAEGKKLTLRIGKEKNGKYTTMEIDAGGYVNVTFPSSFGGDPETTTSRDIKIQPLTVQVPYSDAYFLSGDGGFSQETALASLGLSAAAMSKGTGQLRDANIRSALAQMGFTDLQTFNYDTNLNDVCDDVPFAIGTKVVEKDAAEEKKKEKHRIIVVSVAGDIEVSAFARAWVAGGNQLDVAARAVTQQALSYIEDVWNAEEEVLHLWFNGFSWGGTIADTACYATAAQIPADTKHDEVAYTFGAFGNLSGRGYHLAYEHDLIALGLVNDSSGQIVFENVSKGAEEQYVIASIFHELTNGNTNYTPRWYEADSTLSDVLNSYQERIFGLDQKLAAAILWTFLVDEDDSGFQQTGIEQTHEKVMELVGESADTLDMISKRARAQEALKMTSLPLLSVLPERYAEDFASVLCDLILIDEYLLSDERNVLQQWNGNADVLNGGEEETDGLTWPEWMDSTSPFVGTEQEEEDGLTWPEWMDPSSKLIGADQEKQDGKPYNLDSSMPRAMRDQELFELFLQVNDALSMPTDAHSIAFAHHPEMYFAWLFGTSAKTLIGEYEASVYDAEVLPLPINLQGTVLDKLTSEPIANAKVTITGNGITQVHTTDVQGEWSTYVDRADYRITFECSGYKTVTKDVSRTMFGDEPIELLVELEQSVLPLLEAKVGDFTIYDNGVWHNNEEVMTARAESKEPGIPAPEINLTLTEKQLDKYTSVYDTLTIDCVWLEPYTLNLPTDYGLPGNEYFGITTCVNFYAADMGDGQYTYVLELQGEGPTYCTKVIVLREDNDRLYEALAFDYLGDTTCLHGPKASDTFVDYTQAGPGSSGSVGIATPGIFRQKADFDVQSDGTYDLLLQTTECTDGGTYVVHTRYRLIDGYLTIIAQWVNLPFITAKVGDFSYQNGSSEDWVELPVVMEDYFKTANGDAAELEMKLSLSKRSDSGRATSGRYDTLTLACDWLEPYVFDLREAFCDCEGCKYHIAFKVYVDAADMGDGTYTYAVTFADEGYHHVVLILREVNGQLVPMLHFDHLGKTDTHTNGIIENRPSFIDYTQAQYRKTSECTIMCYRARFEEKEDGTYDLIITTVENGSEWVYDVDTRYSLINGVLTIVEQTVDGEPITLTDQEVPSVECPISFAPLENVGNDINLMNQVQGRMLFSGDCLYYRLDYPAGIKKVNLRNGEVTEVVGDTSGSCLNMYKDKLYFVDYDEIKVVDLATGVTTTLVEVEAPRDYKQSGRLYTGYGEVEYMLIVGDYMFYTTKTGWHYTSEGSVEEIMALDLNTGVTYGPLYDWSVPLATDGEYIFFYGGSSMYRMALNAVPTGATLNQWEDGLSYDGDYYEDDLIFGRNGFCFLSEEENTYIAYPYSEAGKEDPQMVVLSDTSEVTVPGIGWDFADRSVSETGQLAISDNEGDKIIIFTDLGLQEYVTIMDVESYDMMGFYQEKLYVIRPNGIPYIVVYDSTGTEVSRFSIPKGEE